MSALYPHAARILVPVDFSDASHAALAYAAGLAPSLDAEIVVLHALELPLLGLASPEPAWGSPCNSELARDAEHELERLVDSYRDRAPFVAPVLTTGDPRDAIVETAQQLDCDLIVMSTHTRRGLARVLLGSVTAEIVRLAPCPVLALPVADA